MFRWTISQFLTGRFWQYRNRLFNFNLEIKMKVRANMSRAAVRDAHGDK